MVGLGRLDLYEMVLGHPLNLPDSPYLGNRLSFLSPTGGLMYLKGRFPRLERNLHRAALHDALAYHKGSDRGQNLVLDYTLERTGSVLWAMALLRKPELHLRREVKRDTLCRKALGDLLYLFIDNLDEGFLREHIKDDDVIETVEELRTEVVLERAHELILQLIVLNAFVSSI